MKERYLKKLERHLMIKYTLIVFAFSLSGVLILYVFDNVLNGVVIDFIKVLAIQGDPFLTFRNMFGVVLPIIIIVTAFFLVYFLARELSSYVRVLMDGINDVLAKQRVKLLFPKELQQTQKLLLSIADEYQQNALAAFEDDEKKKDLIYLLAQDLKIPLSNILMYLELLEKEKRISSEIRKEFMIVILHKSLDLEDMMNEFFDIARFNLHYSKFNPEQMYLDRMIEQVFDEYYYLLEEKNMQVSLHYDHAFPYYADTDKLARVMRDLLSNMITIGKANSTIEITLETSHDGYRIVLHGKAFHLSAYQIAHIFHNYYRLEDVHGNGKQHVLGLGIAKAIIDMHKGSLRASSIGDDMCFYIELPIQQKQDDATNESMV